MRCRALAAVAVLAWVGACTLVVSTDGLSGPETSDADAGQPDALLDAFADASPDADPGACTPNVDCPPPPPVPTSCVGGGAGVGNDCTAGADCCTTTLVPGGTFLRSNDAGVPATVSPFYLDRFEITVGRYRKFVNAGKGTKASPPADGAGAHPRVPGSGWQASFNALLPTNTTELRAAVTCSTTEASWSDTPGSGESRPIVCSTWLDAFAFCIWDGGRLPTEAEWNFAAAGGAQQRYYPWSVPPTSRAVDSTYAVYGCRANKDGGTCNLSELPPVGSRSPRGDGRWGHADLAGSINEWTFDWSAPYALPCTDCANVTAATERVKRGEEWRYAVFLSTTGRDHDVPTLRIPGGGIRCAR